MFGAGAANHQDWKQVVFSKKDVSKSVAEIQKTGVPKATVSTTTGCAAYKIEQAADGDAPKLALVSRTDANAIIGGRLEKKWSRVDLARKCNIDVKTIEQIETCKAFENKKQLSLIKKALGLIK